MTGGLMLWWRGRTLRERTLLSAMLVVMALVLAWLLLVRPLNAALVDARARHDLAVLRLAEVRAQAAAIRRLESRRSPAIAEPLDALIGRAATEAGFPAPAVTMAGPDRATLALPAVRPQAFFGWIGQIEARGLIVERMSATRNADQTLSVQLGVRARGR